MLHWNFGKNQTLLNHSLSEQTERKATLPSEAEARLSHMKFGSHLIHFCYVACRYRLKWTRWVLNFPKTHFWVSEQQPLLTMEVSTNKVVYIASSPPAIKRRKSGLGAGAERYSTVPYCDQLWKAENLTLPIFASNSTMQIQTRATWCL